MKKTTIIRLLAFAAATGAAQAATTYTTQVLVRFNETVSGSTYTLGAGEIDTTGTFKANGTPTVNLGTASLDGGTSNDGFDFNPASLGALTTQNWVAEAILSFDAFETGQRTIIDVQGDTDIRVNNNGNGLEALYWDGSTTTPVGLAAGPEGFFPEVIRAPYTPDLTATLLASADLSSVSPRHHTPRPRAPRRRPASGSLPAIDRYAIPFLSPPTPAVNRRASKAGWFAKPTMQTTLI